MTLKRVTTEEIEAAEARAADIRKEKEAYRTEQAEYLDKKIAGQNELRGEIEKNCQDVIKAVSNAEKIFVDEPKEVECELSEDGKGMLTHIVLQHLTSSHSLYWLDITQFIPSKTDPRIPVIFELYSSSVSKITWATHSGRFPGKSADLEEYWFDEDPNYKDKNSPQLKEQLLFGAMVRLYILDLIQKKMEQLGMKDYSKGVLNLIRKDIIPYTKKDERFVQVPKVVISR